VLNNLIVICGKWSERNDHSLLELEKFFNYLPFGLDSCDVIIASDTTNKVDINGYQKRSGRSYFHRLKQIEVRNNCEDSVLFAYKCLERAYIEKNNREMEMLNLYDLCFFIDIDNLHKMKWPEKFIGAYERGIVVFDPRTVHLTSTGPYAGANFTTVSSIFWYCKSVEFDCLSKFYKGKHYNEQAHSWEIQTSRNLEIEGNYDLFFYYFIRRIGFNFIYAN
jgi:hypothetical protein